MTSRAIAVSAPLLPVAQSADPISRRISHFAELMGAGAIALLLFVLPVQQARAQSNNQSPIIVTPPVVDYQDENHVSVISGKAQFTIPALKLGDVSFVPYSYNGQHFAQGGVADQNYGSIVQCQGVLPSQGGYSGAYECAIGGTTNYGIQTIYGQDRSTFVFGNSAYSSYSGDGSTFVDNGSTCTWTKRDGTQIVYVAYHDSGNPICKSNNISKIIYPDGRIATYYYYGSFSTAVYGWSPLLSIATNSGYLLKYNYSGTPKWGSETSVTAINRAFETCDPAAQSCSLTNVWPTSTLTFVDKIVSVSDGFPSISPTYSGTRHYTFTIEEASHRKHVFELDSYFRVISYQPPEATTPQYTYNLCSNLVGDGLRYCFGQTHWYHLSPFDMPPLYFDAVESATRNGQTWQYGAQFTIGSLPYNSTWWRWADDPRGGIERDAKGNSTPGTETLYGGTIKTVDLRDGSVVDFAWSVANPPVSVLTPAGIKTQYGYDGRGNLQTVTRNPVANSGAPVIVQSATYPAACSNMKTCNKPTAVIDGNGNQTDFAYDSSHGGTLTVTSPAIAGGRPETRYTYVQRKAWYLGTNGVMAGDANLIWVLSTESVCAAGSSCTMVTTYDYGPDSGPNNLLVRGKTVVAGTTLRTCYGHDKQGNKIWETSPNANPSSCPAY